MRTTILIATVVAALSAAGAGLASAHLSEASSAHAAAPIAPFSAPQGMPRPDRSVPGAAGFRSSGQLAAGLASTAPPVGGSAGGASVTITATVLPSVLIVVDASGRVTSLTTNTPERSGADVLYAVRSGAADGAATKLTPAIWRQTRSALSSTREGVGEVWTAPSLR